MGRKKKVAELVEPMEDVSPVEAPQEESQPVVIEKKEKRAKAGDYEAHAKFDKFKKGDK